MKIQNLQKNIVYFLLFPIPDNFKASFCALKLGRWFSEWISEDWSLNPQNPHRSPVGVAAICNSSRKEVE